LTVIRIKSKKGVMTMEKGYKVIPNDKFEETIFKCPHCGDIVHTSMFVAYEPTYERIFHCKNCAQVFYRATWGQSWGK